MARGMRILLAGLVMQITSIMLLLAVYWYFIWSLHHRLQILDPRHDQVYSSAKFKIFLLCELQRKPIVLNGSSNSTAN
jgi:hypothetical protein